MHTRIRYPFSNRDVLTPPPGSCLQTKTAEEAAEELVKQKMELQAKIDSLEAENTLLKESSEITDQPT